ncbi:transferrin receptor-like dimerization domain-containing protein [Mucilaginibacter sp. UR6-11]|uniref:transferrin receptor-like dimerization domain-containing protein n=1 Tax=Mucilaginibacter sp. UR6-11 TaxID=1435644 RepID=UPI001E31261B|nr:transferrin receptor-like dimerization domain-containing protein [Mucilaginibacter sp. UR6-11]MCC8426787.1 M28 family peptidase [Mucilaginibacter sp. UR6-11]
MKKIFAFGFVAFTTAAYAQAQQKTLMGFTPAASARQLQTEQQFDKSISPARIGETLKDLSAYPHHIGSPGGKVVAEKILQKFKSYGWDAHLQPYKVLFPTPKTRLLEMTGPTKYTAVLKESILAEDPTSGQAGQLPTYNAWSADGDVTGQLVFVNYGLPEDYEMLASMNIDVKGKIVIAKYGKSWRGIKPKVAYEHGAIGCIIYSDPKDDGYFAGDVYPKGAFKNETGVQRGSVMDMVIYPGDPLTPGVGATENARRLDRKDAQTILKIPVLPISYQDAKPLLAALGGPVAPAEWRGALPFTYHVGPGAATVHLKLEFNWDLVTAYDVIAQIKGSAYPDEWVMRGNHHDAWVNGADDPLSGQTAMLDEAKALGDLLKTGWKPKRTIVYCAWDGEEPGLLGSTEFVEDHDKELQQKAVVYINSDDISRGIFHAGGSHALESFVGEVSEGINDPETNVTAAQRKKAYQLVNATSINAKREILNRHTEPIEALGSGSDFSSFLQHLGIPTLDIGYGGEGAGGEYHSIYDSFADYQRFKDPGFVYGAVLAKTVGHTVLRMADAELLPFDFRSLSATLDGYGKELVELANNMRENTAMQNQLVRSNAFNLAADPKKMIAPPQAKAEVPPIDFSALTASLNALKTSADKLAIVMATASASNINHKALNETIYKAEQQLLAPAGLPRRPWYKHAIYAPGFYTGYGVKTMPGIREAIEQRNWPEMKEQIAVVSATISALAAYLSKAAM